MISTCPPNIRLKAPVFADIKELKSYAEIMRRQ
jgi:hypothetical protein